MLKMLDTSQKHVVLVFLERLKIWLASQPKEGKYEEGG